MKKKKPSPETITLNYSDWVWKQVERVTGEAYYDKETPDHKRRPIGAVHNLVENSRAEGKTEIKMTVQQRDLIYSLIDLSAAPHVERQMSLIRQQAQAKEAARLRGEGY